MSESMAKSANVLDIETARAKRQDFSVNTGFDTAGAYLHSVREKLEFSIEDVSAKTHISAQHIQGIETGDLSLLPPRAYVSGFVKTYAEFLDLDPQPIVTRFKEDVGLTAPQEIDASQFEQAESLADSEKSQMSLFAVLAILAFMLWSAWQIMSPRDPEITLETPAGFPPPPISQQAPAILDPLTEVAPIGENEVLARIIEKIEPVYPRFCEARAKDVESVEMSFNVTRQGRVSGLHVLSSTNGCFERAAANVVKRWRFSPRKVDNIAQPSYDQVVTLSFKKPA